MQSYEGYIYVITNKINNKVYVGQTIHSLRDRFNAHCEKHSGCTKLKNAINKYGRENFSIESLAIIKAPTKDALAESLDRLEIYYIG